MTQQISNCKQASAKSQILELIKLIKQESQENQAERKQLNDQVIKLQDNKLQEEEPQLIFQNEICQQKISQLQDQVVGQQEFEIKYRKLINDIQFTQIMKINWKPSLMYLKMKQILQRFKSKSNQSMHKKQKYKIQKIKERIQMQKIFEQTQQLLKLEALSKIFTEQRKEQINDLQNQFNNRPSRQDDLDITKQLEKENEDLQEQI
ncbi:unnamed protein product [Paramecium octaurelia]|uniref:Uncharacterized protein n=1 Tax=Paramecium octaurelia TaxID=43137 RepID=A0A8S1UA08_PAROT|nr:unnamed protein product [Paramecium octaurelia]